MQRFAQLSKGYASKLAGTFKDDIALVLVEYLCSLLFYAISYKKFDTVTVRLWKN